MLEKRAPGEQNGRDILGIHRIKSHESSLDCFHRAIVKLSWAN